MRWRHALLVNLGTPLTVLLVCAATAFLLSIDSKLSTVFASDRYDAGQAFRDCADCPEMVVVPAGNFVMGSSAAESARDLRGVPAIAAGVAWNSAAQEKPDHPVTIARPFAVGKYPVTRAEFAAFIRETGYATAMGSCVTFLNHKYPRPPGAGWQYPGFAQTDRDPVLCVSWHDAQAYIAWLNSKLVEMAPTSGPRDGLYRLPSEAEWEHAARAGTRTTRWWGDAIGRGNAVCEGCGSPWDKKQPAPVGSFHPNAFGLFDMLGSASQWIFDCWKENYADAPQDGSAWTSENCKERVVRGGDWANESWFIRSSYRTRSDAENHANYIGFRVARTLP